MAALVVIGDWLEGSVWTSSITQANIATSGKAECHAHKTCSSSNALCFTYAYEISIQRLYVISFRHQSTF